VQAASGFLDPVRWRHETNLFTHDAEESDRRTSEQHDAIEVRPTIGDSELAHDHRAFAVPRANYTTDMNSASMDLTAHRIEGSRRDEEASAPIPDALRQLGIGCFAARPRTELGEAVHRMSARRQLSGEMRVDVRERVPAREVAVHVAVERPGNEKNRARQRSVR